MLPCCCATVRGVALHSTLLLHSAARLRARTPAAVAAAVAAAAALVKDGSGWVSRRTQQRWLPACQWAGCSRCCRRARCSPCCASLWPPSSGCPSQWPLLLLLSILQVLLVLLLVLWRLPPLLCVDALPQRPGDAVPTAQPPRPAWHHPP